MLDGSPSETFRLHIKRSFEKISQRKVFRIKRVVIVIKNTREETLKMCLVMDEGENSVTGGTLELAR